MMCWNSETKNFVTKGMNTDVKNLKENSQYKPCFVVFDILYLNGSVITNQPLNYRLDLLAELITPEEGVVVFPNRKRISNKEEVWDSLNEAIENREEGIVMKDFLSVYKPNVRKNGGWYKLKPEYTDGLMDALDVLIIGGYYGSGRHKGNISHFLLGVAVDGDPEKFYSVARVGSGYSMDELSELQMKLKPHWNKVNLKEMPVCMEWTKEKPDLWIEPSKSFILQVKASEIMPSDSFKTGYTLRFPRVEQVRYDKSWTECLTLSEFERKRNVASGKLVKRGFESSGTDESVSPKKSPRTNISLPEHYRAADLTRIKCRSDLLRGKEICVLSGFKEFSKSDLEKKIAEFGGTLVQNPGTNTFCALAEEESNVRIINIVKCDAHDVVRTSWFLSQLKPSVRSIPEFTPEVLLGKSKKTSEKFEAIYDEYGDKFTEPADRKSLEHPFYVIETKVERERLTAEDMYDLDVELFSGVSPYGVFRCCTAYFDRFPIIGDAASGCLFDLEVPQIDFRFHGGVCDESIRENTTHVIVSKKDLRRVPEFHRINRERLKKFHITTDEWIASSLRERSRMREEEFRPDVR
ncbi:UNVERIFIED_CONTAM: hypothetical protein PYX00_000538 [Menopon gallinae]|uniref:DNA ligase 4 n=1 Tax=Menopon gallinae TaxID=328185 RepID=A0AAW2IAG5_9NEOP